MIFKEVLLLLLLMALLFWLSRMVLDRPRESSLEEVREACNAKGIRRIEMIPEAGHLWIDRPRDLSMCLNLHSGEIEDSVNTQDLEFVTHGPDGRSRLTCTDTGMVMLESQGKEPLVAQLPSRRGRTIEAVVSRDPEVALCLTEDGHVCGWDTSHPTASPFHFQIAGSSTILAMAIVPPAGLLIARRNGHVSHHEFATGQTQGPSVALGCDCIGGAWDQQGRELGIVTSGGDVEVFDWRTARRTGRLAGLRRFSLQTAAILEFSPDREWIATAAATSLGATLWHRVTGRTYRLTAHRGIVSALAFSADSRRIYTGSYDGTVREWSVSPFQELRIVTERPRVDLRTAMFGAERGRRSGLERISSPRGGRLPCL